MSTLADIEAAVGALSPQEKAQVLALLTAQLENSPVNLRVLDRTPGLHAGAWEVAADFDTPLPEEFWLGGEE